MRKRSENGRTVQLRLSSGTIFRGMLVILILLTNVTPVLAATAGEIKTALPAAGEITQGLVHQSPYELRDDSAGPANRYISAIWSGYVPITCPERFTRVDTVYGDYLRADIAVVSHDEVYPVSDTPESFRENDLNLAHESPYYAYDEFPGGVKSEGKADPENGRSTHYWCSIYAWVDDRTEIRTEVVGTVTNSVYEKAGCNPPYVDRDHHMQELVRSEADRITKLTYERLGSKQPGNPCPHGGVTPSEDGTRTPCPIE